MNLLIIFQILTGVLATIIFTVASLKAGKSQRIPWMLILIAAIFYFLSGYLGNLGTSIGIKENLKAELAPLIAEFDKIKNMAISEETKEKIQKLQNDFNKWYDNFLANKEIRKKEVELVESKIKIDLARVSDEYRSIYCYFFESLKTNIININSRAAGIIEYEVPDFPPNIYSDEANKYRATIKFADGTKWRLLIIGSRDLGSMIYPEVRLPVIDIDVDNQNYSQSKLFRQGFQIHFSLDTNTIVFPEDDYKLKIYGLNNNYDLKDYKVSIDEIIRKILEYQLIKSAK